ncbi:Os05g0493500, partial [Oryza sativa Japonica Group]
RESWKSEERRGGGEDGRLLRSGREFAGVLGVLGARRRRRRSNRRPYAWRRGTSARLPLRSRRTEVLQSQRGSRRPPPPPPPADLVRETGKPSAISATKIQLPEGINRPITRSFGAQLLKKAQENAVAANKIVVQNPARKEPAPKPAKKVVPRPENAAKASTGAGVNENKKPSESEGAGSSSGGSALKYSRKKVVNTLTSVLTARSKHACGITEKPKEVVEDIDKLDGDNQLAVVEYIEDIYNFYRTAQLERRPTDYMSSQVEVNPKMRAILADWIIDVHYKFELMPETLYLTMYVIDRYLSLQPVLRRELQLVGVAAMLIASKYEEMWAPEVQDLIHVCDNAYSRQHILAMEKNILNRLQWNITVPTPYVFLLRFIKAAGGDKELENMVFFFSEMALKEYGMASLCPSLVAASAVYAAQCTLKRSPLWTSTLKHHTGFTESQLRECAKVLVNAHAAAPESKLKTAYRKYASEQLGRVSLRPPAVCLA